MSKFKNYTLTAAGLVIFALAMALANTVRVQGDDLKNVRVVNTAGEPVPTRPQGTTTIAGTVGFDPKNNVVGLAPGSGVCINPSCNTVQVGNAADSPVLVRDVDNPARHPFQQMRIMSFNHGSIAASTTISVPEGKRLVIEFVSADGRFPSGQLITQMTLTTIVNSQLATHSIVPTPIIDARGSSMSAAQQMRVYADPPNLFLNALRTDVAGAFDIRVSPLGTFSTVVPGLLAGAYSDGLNFWITLQGVNRLARF